MRESFVGANWKFKLTKPRNDKLLRRFAALKNPDWLVKE